MNFTVANQAHYGGGLGSVLSTLWRASSPIIRRIFGSAAKVATSKSSKALLREAQRSALNAGLRVASDALDGRNIASSAKQNLNKVSKDVINRAVKMTAKNKPILNRRPPKKKRKQSPTINASVNAVKKIKFNKAQPNKGKANDIFDDQNDNEFYDLDASDF